MTREEALGLYYNVRYNATGNRQKEAVDMAFAALREQSEGCEFCTEPYAVMSGSRMDKDAVHKGCEAKYCPNCGRKLEEDNNG